MGKKSQERMTGMTYEERVMNGKLNHPVESFEEQMKKSRRAFLRWMRKRFGW